MIEYLSLADYLLIAEAVLEIEAEVLAFSVNLHLADSALNAPAAAFDGHEAHPTFAAKAAVLCCRLCNNHPLPDGNKRAAYLSLREFVARNGYEWHPPADDGLDGDETVKVIWGIAAGTMTEQELTQWIEQRIEEQT